MEEHGSNYGHTEHCHTALMWSTDSRHAVLTLLIPRGTLAMLGNGVFTQCSNTSTESATTTGVSTQCSNKEY